MTVPIYWGCTNIGDYFNTDGMLIVKSLRGMIKACNSITPEIFQRMRPAMEDNLERSGKYVDMTERLTASIRDLVADRVAGLAPVDS